MGLFQKDKGRVLRKGVGSTTEERKLKKVGRHTVEVRRVVEPEPPKPTKTAERKRRSSRGRERGGRQPQQKQQPPAEVVTPPETDRKQMLIRTLPHQVQIVVLEGNVLVEHYVAREDRQSLVGNVYVGKVRNVLPGMEAAFIDFGAGKNGVLYAGDVLPESEDGNGGRRKVRIERALKQGEEVLVQVVKDAMGHKGARLTNEVSLPGRYLVLAPNSDMKGISRRIPDNERERLRDILSDLRPPGFGVIVRTAAEDASREDLAADIERLMETWREIEKKIPGASAPRLLYEEPSLVIRVVRENFTKDFRRLLIDDKRTHDMVVDYLQRTEPHLAEKVRFYEDELPLFERFHVQDQIRKALDRKVWLPSGGHIVIDRTEALTVIDVNTGRFVGHSNLEDTVLQNNLEAAEEIARQLRLRDIGGIIVIDFIDMEVARNREAVLQCLREQLAKDKTRSQVFEVSHLGLVEMTRKNASEGLLETFSEVCDKCGGRGVLLHEEAAALGRPIEEEHVHLSESTG